MHSWQGCTNISTIMHTSVVSAFVCKGVLNRKANFIHIYIWL